MSSTRLELSSMTTRKPSLSAIGEAVRRHGPPCGRLTKQTLDSDFAIQSAAHSGTFLRRLRRAREDYPETLYKVFPELAQYVRDAKPTPNVSYAVPLRLKWDSITPSNFEELIFDL